MFWGNGDTSELEVSEKEVLDALRRMVETGHIVALSPRQSEVFLRALALYEKWEGALELLGSLRNILIFAGGGLAFWWATGGENFVSDWVRSVGVSP